MTEALINGLGKNGIAYGGLAVIVVVALIIWGYAFQKWGFLVGLTLGWIPAGIASVVLFFLLSGFLMLLGN